MRKKMDFTGERFIPKVNQGFAFYYEHLIRYLFSSQFVNNKIVLDIACGTGYGSYLLATQGKAKQVLAVDCSPESVRYAKDNYPQKNINYLVDDAETLSKVKDKTIDIVVSFETIEHLKHQKEFLIQIKRVLKPDGLLIISTPNINNYPSGNSYHVHELTHKQFQKSLKNHFNNINILGQKYSFAQEIFQIQKPDFRFNDTAYVSYQPSSLSETRNVENCEYFIAVCSNKKTPLLKNFTITADKIDNIDLTRGLALYTQKLNDALDEYQRITASKIYFLWPLYNKLKSIFHRP